MNSDRPSCATFAPAVVVVLSVPAAPVGPKVMTRRGHVTFEAYTAFIAFEAGTPVSFKATSVANFVDA